MTTFSRRDVLKTGLGAGALGLAGCGSDRVSIDPSQRLRALCSNAGLSSSWCALGRQTMELWGQLLNIEIVWVDGAMSAEVQRNRMEAQLLQDWDFCCVQAVQQASLAPTCAKLAERGVPVLSMDTLVVPMEEMRETGVWCQITPDQEWMGEQSTRYLMEKIGGRGKVIHIGGQPAHTGAQGRARGFEKVTADYPEIEVVGGEVYWCDWSPEKAQQTFESLMQQETEPIAGAFFHSDDMAVGCLGRLEGKIHEGMVITAVDGQDAGLTEIERGRLAATTVNPVCRIHKTALTIGQFIARNDESIDQVPLEIVTPGPLVSRETPRILEAMRYLADEDHCMV